MAGDKTEAPTPKRLEEARKKGQVAKSADLNGAVVMLAGLFAMSAAGPKIVGNLREAMVSSLGQISDPEVVSLPGLGGLLSRTGGHLAGAMLPVAGACMVAAILVNVGQVGFKPNLALLKPDPKKLNPVSGFKQIYGKHALAELVKNLVKVSVVAGIVAAALLPQISTFAGMVGIAPAELSSHLIDQISALAKRAGIAYLVIGL